MPEYIDGKKDVEFVNGLIFKLPHENAPDFVKGSLSIRREELITFLTTKEDDWINIDLKVSKNGKAYAQVNNWSPEKQEQPQVQHQTPSQPAPQSNDDFDDDIPF